MAVSVEYRDGHGLSLAVNEITGALGDSVTVLPILVALGVLTPVSLPHALLGFGVFQIVWGIRYGLPVSVEPMKALAGLTIAGVLTYGELITAGLLAGGVLLVLGASDGIGYVERYVGMSVIRGIQLAVAFILLEAGLTLVVDDLTLAFVGLAIAGLVALVSPRASALCVLAVGTGLAALGGVPSPTLPSLGLFPSGGPALTTNALTGTLAQLAMTVGNAAVATSLLFSDLLDAEVTSDDLATSMGTMNLLGVPFGALPMCHGSGGLAGKYAFGARTGGANVILGALYLAAALVAGLWLHFPLAILGILLVVVAGQLGRVALDSDRLWIVLGVGILGLLVNVGVAFIVGIAAHTLLTSERWTFARGA